MLGDQEWKSAALAEMRTHAAERTQSNGVKGGGSLQQRMLRVPRREGAECRDLPFSTLLPFVDSVDEILRCSLAATSVVLRFPILSLHLEIRRNDAWLVGEVQTRSQQRVQRIDALLPLDARPVDADGLLDGDKFLL